MERYCKRLIEVDLPIKRISAHARSARRKRRGNIAALHYWWARRPSAACRAVTLATLLPDPVDFVALNGWSGVAAEGSRAFLHNVERLLVDFAPRWLPKASPESFPRVTKLGRGSSVESNPEDLQGLLLEFVSDFSSHLNSTDPDFLKVAQELVMLSHKALVDSTGKRPLIVDPFAGGGAIPLEARRLGADVCASDLNPVAVLLNKVILEFAPQGGQSLVENVQKWGAWVLETAIRELAQFYPSDADGSTPIAYLWARTLECIGPGCGSRVPLLSNLNITKHRTPPIVVQMKRKQGEVELDIREQEQGESIGPGTVRGGTVTCPVCGFSMSSKEYRAIGSKGKLGELMFGVILSRPEGRERIYRSVTENDRRAFELAENALRQFQPAWSREVPALPFEPISPDEPRRLNVRQYGFVNWGQLFNSRQQLSLATFGDVVIRAHQEIERQTGDSAEAKAISTILALCVSNISHYLTNMSMYLSDGMVSAFIQSSAIAMRSDYAEANPLMQRLVGGFEYQVDRTVEVLQSLTFASPSETTVLQMAAQEISLPDDSADVLVTDPPYYYSIPYSDLSDLFFVWLKRFLVENDYGFFKGDQTPKAQEAVQSLPHSKSPSKRDRAHYEQALLESFERGRIVVKPSGLAIVVFAHAATSAWEVLLGALINAGWTITASWPIDTENPDRMLANRQSTLSSSIHLVCRPREDPDGSLRTGDVGDWRDVLAELPKRIHEWMPRLAEEGVVGADAIFACLGPALEIYSRYSSVEKASGERVTLKEYLEQVWAAVAREALRMIFEGADASGFEEDARLTAMWLWTLRTALEEHGDDEAESEKTTSLRGYSLEYDAARKIAQGLGAHLENLTHLIEIKGSTATLLSAGARTRYLFGKDTAEAPRGRAKRKPQMTLDFEGEVRELEQESGDWAAEISGGPGATVLDQLHQSMIMFGAGRGEALRRFLVEDAVGQNPLFWRLAQAFSALYPSGTDEKRWVDGVLARKKGLGL